MSKISHIIAQNKASTSITQERAYFRQTVRTDWNSTAVVGGFRSRSAINSNITFSEATSKFEGFKEGYIYEARGRVSFDRLDANAVYRFDLENGLDYENYGILYGFASIDNGRNTLETKRLFTASSTTKISLISNGNASNGLTRQYGTSVEFIEIGKNDAYVPPKPTVTTTISEWSAYDGRWLDEAGNVANPQLITAFAGTSQLNVQTNSVGVAQILPVNLGSDNIEIKWNRKLSNQTGFINLFAVDQIGTYNPSYNNTAGLSIQMNQNSSTYTRGDWGSSGWYGLYQDDYILRINDIDGVTSTAELYMITNGTTAEVLQKTATVPTRDWVIAVGNNADITLEITGDLVDL